MFALWANKGGPGFGGPGFHPEESPLNGPQWHMQFDGKAEGPRPPVGTRNLGQVSGKETSGHRVGAGGALHRIRRLGNKEAHRG